MTEKNKVKAGKIMNTFKIKLLAVPLKIRSIDIFLTNGLLSILVKKRKLRSSKLVLFLDDVLTEKRERMNKKTEEFIKNHYLALER